MEHRFSGPSYTIGIEEELMILDAETLELSNSIERMLEAATPDELTGEVKPELMESVLEIATQPCRTTAEAGEQLRGLRRLVRAVGQLPVLARRRHRAALDPHADLPRLPAGGDPAHVPRLGRLRAPNRVHGRVRRDRGLHLPVVRRAPAPELRHRRGPRDRRADAGGAHARARRARAGHGQGTGRALRSGQVALALPVRDARREQVAGRAPRARRRARGPAGARPGIDQGTGAAAS